MDVHTGFVPTQLILFVVIPMNFDAGPDPIPEHTNAQERILKSHPDPKAHLQMPRADADPIYLGGVEWVADSPIYLGVG